MRQISGISVLAWVLCFVGCSAAPLRYMSTPPYADQVDTLLKSRPNDPDLLFLRHEHRQLGMCAKLASLRPTPLVLASVVDKHLSHGFEEDNRREFEETLKVWIRLDPENALPIIINGLIEVASGDLSTGLETLIRSSDRKQFRSYSLEWGRETLHILKEEKLATIENLVSLQSQDSLGYLFSLDQCVMSACTLLGQVSFQKQLRGDVREAKRLAEAQYRLAIGWSEDASSLSAVSRGADQLGESAERLCELYLQLGDEAGAQRFALAARSAKVSWECLREVLKRGPQKDPIQRLLKRARTPKAPDSDPWRDLIPTQEEWDRFWRLAKEEEEELKPQLEEAIHMGSRAILQEDVGEGLRQSVALQPLPIDAFWRDRRIFYPIQFGRDSRKTLVKALGTHVTGDDDETVGFLRSRAMCALLHHKDPALLEELRNEFLRNAEAGLSIEVAVVLAALGDESDQVLQSLESSLDCEPAAGWAIAKLGYRKFIPDLVQTLIVDLWPNDVTRRYQEAVPAYFSLRDLTGQDFGFDESKWDSWAERTGNKKK